MVRDVVHKILTSPDFQKDIVKIQTDYLMKLQRLAFRYGISLSAMTAMVHAPLMQTALNMEEGNRNAKEL